MKKSKILHHIKIARSMLRFAGKIVTADDREKWHDAIEKSFPNRETGTATQFTDKDLEKQKKSDERAYQREKWRNVKNLNKITLLEGQDDAQIAQIKEMLFAILEQPELKEQEDLTKEKTKDDIDWQVRKERAFAKSILGISDLDRKASAENPFENIKTIEDFSQDELENIEAEQLQREMDDAQFQSKGYTGWERVGQDGKKVYVLTGKQMNVITRLYENAQLRMQGINPYERQKQEREEKQKKSDKVKSQMQEVLEKAKQKKKDRSLSEDLGLSDDLGIEELDDFGKTSALHKKIQNIRSSLRKL